MNSAVEVDFPAVLERAKRILMESRSSLQKGFEKTHNPKLLRGSARFEGREIDASGGRRPALSSPASSTRYRHTQHDSSN